MKTTAPLTMIWRMMRQGGWWYVINLSVIVSLLLVELLPGLINRQVLNDLQSKQQMSIPWLLLAALLGITLTRVVLWFSMAYTNPQTRVRSENVMRRSLLARIFQQPAVAALKGSPGEIVSRFRDDIGEMPHVVLQLNDIIALSGFAAVSFYVMYHISASATIAIAAPLVLIVVGARFAYNRIYVYRQERRRATGRVVGSIAETFGAIQAVQVAGAEQHVLQHFDELNHIREKATLREVLFDGLLDAMFRNAVSLGTAIMMFMVYKRLFHDSTIPDQMPLPRLAHMQVRNLAVQWANGSYGIRGVDLDLAPGRLVVVTGAVGAGKTTLLRAVLGMLPRVEGEIIWNGEKITNPDLQLLPPAVAYTSQVPRLFSDSIVENITQGRDVADSEMDDAIYGAVFEYDIAQFEHGVSTMVGSRGVRLSGGQIQRAAFARMLYERPQVWLIDDVSSALDILTEKKLWERFIAIRNEVACLIVTHRPQVMSMANEVIVLKNGEIAARGSYVELLANGMLSH